MRKSLIIGKNGLIADRLSYLIDDMYSNNLSYEFTTSSIEVNNDAIFLDLENPEKFNYSILKHFSYVILLGGISSPDICQNDPIKSKKINFDGTKFFIHKCLKKGVKVLFFSTDLVYGESDSVMNELSNVNPKGNYAIWKYGIESAFKNHINFKVLRLSYVLSSNDKYVKYLKECKIKNSIAEVYDSFLRNVIYIDDLILAIINLLKNWQPEIKVVNVCGVKSISRFDIAKNLLHENSINVINAPKEFWENRPKNIQVESLFLRKILQKNPTSFKEVMDKLKSS